MADLIAPVIDLRDLCAARHGQADTRTEEQQLLYQARTEGYAAGHNEGFYAGMQAAMESMRAEVPTMLRPRTLTAVQMGGWAS